jgi:hypothetical protein
VTLIEEIAAIGARIHEDRIREASLIETHMAWEFKMYEAEPSFFTTDEMTVIGGEPDEPTPFGDRRTDLACDIWSEHTSFFQRIDWYDAYGEHQTIRIDLREQAAKHPEED